jgi:hypothetical protein
MNTRIGFDDQSANLVLLSGRTGGENNIELCPSRARWQQIAVPSGRANISTETG